MPPGMGMASGGRPQWQPTTSTPMNYSSSSPGNYGGPPGGGPPGPGTPIMPSPQGKSITKFSHNTMKSLTIAH